MNKTVVLLTACFIVAPTVSAFAQTAILPQAQPSPHGPEVSDRAENGGNGLALQDTGPADPSVNPGPATGMMSVQGRIMTSDEGRHVVRQLSGIDTALFVDARTKGDTNLSPGDVITGTITPQGHAVVLHKEAKAETRLER